MELIFISHGSQKDKNAYSYRIDKFKDYFIKYTDFKACTIYLKDSFFGSPSLLQPLCGLSLIKKINTSEVVYAGNTPAAYSLGLMKKFIRRPIIYDVHGDIVQEYYLLKKNKFNPIHNYLIFQSKIMEFVAKKTADYFITCSGPLKQYYIDQGIDADKIEIIRNGVDITLFKPFNTRFKNNKFVVTYAGAFQKWQGIENLINAAKMVDSSDVVFKIIGFSDVDLSLKKSIKSVLGDAVQLIDILPHSELIKHLNDSDLLIIPRNNHPAINMAMPTKFAEYISMGKPVIVTRVDETADFVEKYDCGFVCDPNPESIADMIIKAKNISNEILFTKGKNARRLAEIEFDQKIINERYYQFMKKILSEKRNT